MFNFYLLNENFPQFPSYTVVLDYGLLPMTSISVKIKKNKIYTPKMYLIIKWPVSRKHEIFQLWKSFMPQITCTKIKQKLHLNIFFIFDKGQGLPNCVKINNVTIFQFQKQHNFCFLNMSYFFYHWAQWEFIYWSFLFR